MRYILVILLISLIEPSLFCQNNLIYNGSFEVLDSCPISDNSYLSSIQCAEGWTNASSAFVTNLNSPDLFNTCETGSLGVPNNWYGYQIPMEGVGYAGIILTRLPFNSAVREFIQSRLVSELKEHCKYKLSFYVSYGSVTSYRTSSLFFLFSGNEILIPNNEAILNYEYFSYNPDSVTMVNCPEVWDADTTNWLYIEKEFYSISDAQYVTVGNFTDSANTTYEFAWLNYMGGIYQGSNIYIDDIKLIQLDSNCVTWVNEIEKKEFVKVYPNPAKGSVTISIPNNEEVILVEFIDVSGRIVKSINLNPSDMQVVDVSTLSAGWYAVSVTRPIAGRYVHPIFIEH